MTKKNIFLTVIVVSLAGLSLYLNRERFFHSDTLQIGHRSVEGRGRRPRPNTSDPGPSIAFLFDREVQLTSVKVIPTAEFETNKYAHPIWNLVSDSNSIPTKAFVYGTTIRGMRPSVKGAVADPLQPGVKYRLFVETGSYKATHDFSLAARTP